MKNQNLIGRKVKGFRFDKPTGSYNTLMDAHIGEVGEITDVHNTSVQITFENNYWTYPLEEAKKHLVDEYPKLMYVGYDSEKQALKHARKRVVFMKKNGKYIAWCNSKSFKEAENETETIDWNYAVEIPQEDEIVKLTLQDISDGKGVGVPSHLIRIKEA